LIFIASERVRVLRALNSWIMRHIIHSSIIHAFTKNMSAYTSMSKVKLAEQLVYCQRSDMPQ
jgi:hypothetical protein